MNMQAVTKILSGLLLVLILPLTVMAMGMDDCLGCHGDSDVVGEDQLITEESFRHTIHAELGCVTCHDSVTDEHPDDGVSISRASCVDCHDGVGEQYQHNSHAEHASCVDCHDPHGAFGLETMSSQGMNRQCTQCHGAEDVVETHTEWLPQAGLHISKLPCITCHAETEGYEVVLHITHKEVDMELGNYSISSHGDLKEYSGDNKIAHLIDLNGDNFISMAELRTFNLNPAYKKLRLEGTLVPSEASHNFTAMDNRYDCTFCHAAGPGSMQISYLAVPNENGSFSRVEIEKRAVLDARYGTPDFYLTGSSRNASMNIIGLIIICGGLIMPIGHGTLRFFTRKNRKH